MKVNGMMIKDMEKDLRNLATETLISVFITKELFMVKDFIIGVQEKTIKESSNKV